MNIRAVKLLALLFAIGACTGVDSEIAVPVTEKLLESKVRVVRQDVIVPAELSVSEANQYLPRADIVWREDPMGDRRAQVKEIVDRGLTWGLSAFDTGTPVAVTLEVRKFHALTERARYSVGGVHTMRFQLIVWNANTGTPLYGPIELNADLVGLGGADALQAEAENRGQKVRIIQHLAGTIQEELIKAGFATNSAQGSTDG